MKAELRRLLVDALGREAVGDGDLVVPATPEAVVAACQLCHQRRVPITVASGTGEQRGVVAGILVSLSALDAIAVDERRAVVRAQAGATLSAIRAAAARTGLLLAAPVDHPGERLGSALALGALPRRVVLALDLVLAGGARVRTGSDLGKDVTGYDLTALVLGSRGALGVVLGASLRLVPEGTAPAGGGSAYPVAHGGREGALTMALRRAFDPAGQLRPDLER
ncbi:MAG: hypothetical protein NVSMB29_19550 [Candidatus Dormibacteria bacterium]